MLVLPSEIHHLVHLRFGDFVWENPAHPDTLLMDVKHDSSGFFHVHSEEALQHDDDEFHGRVVVIQKQYLVLTGLLWLGAGFCGDIRLTVTLGWIVVAGRSRYRKMVVRVDHHRANIVSAGEIASAETSLVRLMDCSPARSHLDVGKEPGRLSKTKRAERQLMPFDPRFSTTGQGRGEKRPVY